MLDTPAKMTRHQVPYTALSSFSDLFKTYCTDYDALAPFYAGDYRRADARADAARRAADHKRDRQALVDILLDQNALWGLDDATRAHIEALRDDASVAVVTGQQVGLLTGPLYTPYKTITALQLARRLHEETGRPVVPVFWLEGEDHDLDEVAGTMLLRGNELAPLRYNGHTLPEGGNLGPVGRLAFTEQIGAVVDELEALLPPTDFRASLMEQVRAAYQPGATLRDAFARLMRAWFPEAGLVFIAPDDDRLKALAAPLFRRELEDYGTVQQAINTVSERLAASYHAQVHTRPTNLFLLQDGQRYPLDAQDDGFTLRGTGQSYDLDTMLDRLETHPAHFSPNVVLRPLMQDLLLPTAAYVAGPGEVAYFAQYKPAYAWAGVPMPVIYPRASVTLVESKIQKVLDRYELTVVDFENECEKLFRRVVLEHMPFDVDATFKAAMRHLHQAINELKPSLEAVDQTLIKTAEATRAALIKEVERLKGRVIKAEKRNHDAIKEQLEKAQINLFPGCKLQERTVSALYFLNKYSPALLRDLQAGLSLDTTTHQVVKL